MLGKRKGKILFTIYPNRQQLALPFLLFKEVHLVCIGSKQLPLLSWELQVISKPTTLEARVFPNSSLLIVNSSQTFSIDSATKYIK